MTVAQVLRVVRVAVVPRLAREAVSLEVRVRRSEVFQVRALVDRVGEADDTGEAERTHPSAFGVRLLVRVVGCIAIERRRMQESGVVFARLAPFSYTTIGDIGTGTLMVAA